MSYSRGRWAGYIRAFWAEGKANLPGPVFSLDKTFDYYDSRYPNFVADFTNFASQFPQYQVLEAFRLAAKRNPGKLPDPQDFYDALTTKVGSISATFQRIVSGAENSVVKASETIKTGFSIGVPILLGIGVLVLAVVFYERGSGRSVIGELRAK